ncbi:MAG: tRNA-dihydrouridine synthase, partial [Patescibacteria group bacterium]
WQDFFEAINETKCDGALIARGALGNPWIFQQIENCLADQDSFEIDLDERIRIVKQHFDLHLRHYGPTSVSTFRKHLSWYFKGLPHFKKFKQQLMTETDPKKLDKILNEVLDTPVNH